MSTHRRRSCASTTFKSDEEKELANEAEVERCFCAGTHSSFEERGGEPRMQRSVSKFDSTFAAFAATRSKRAAADWKAGAEATAKSNTPSGSYKPPNSGSSSNPQNGGELPGGEPRVQRSVSELVGTFAAFAATRYAPTACGGGQEGRCRGDGEGEVEYSEWELQAPELGELV